MKLHPDILDLSPIDPPRREQEPRGRQVGFSDVVAAAGMLNIVTLPTEPDVRLHDGKGDFLVPGPDCPVYCIAEAELPTPSRERAREIMRRLAYGFFDYAAREIVARYHRDLKRAGAAPTMPGGGQAGRLDGDDGKPAMLVFGPEAIAQGTPDLLQAADKGPVIITDGERPKFVLMSMQEFDRLRGRQRTTGSSAELPGNVADEI